MLRGHLFVIIDILFSITQLSVWELCEANFALGDVQLLRPTQPCKVVLDLPCAIRTCVLGGSEFGAYQNSLSA